MGFRSRSSIYSAAILSAAVLAGCAALPAPPEDDCSQAFARFASATAAVRDAQFHRLAGFPGLRSDRVLAALGPRAASSPATRRLWLHYLADNDRAASAIERGNLPPGRPGGLPDEARLASCRQRQIARLAQDPSAFARAIVAARVPSAYRPWARVLGLYPLLRPFYRNRIAAWQREAAAQRAPADSAAWLSYRLAPAPLAERALTLHPDALGLPRADAAQLDALFARHAPELRIAARSSADRPGTPRIDARGRRGFDRRPVLYRHHGWSRLEGRWHLQLVYQWWFSARPADGPLDIYAGELDGMLWRVTLDAHGAALLYDAIHPCGCWHAFFLPADSPLQFRQPADAEQRLARRLAQAGNRAATLWLRGNDHALLWVDGRRAPYPIHRYRLAELDELRSLAHPAGRRSLYDVHGLVPGSQRLERWLLWPAGVVSPGAMRQWGRHATAFIGEAHFDDPDLLGRYFQTRK
ncbi:hypothetical protein [Pseudomonas oryzae]|uniref:Uncharacterized protein n=1 Tax=Pseudomonas oryzae TaxID=1392877 RepID=A0A1H1L805_9PSED|nr:hypothetical protein [Pseudomonas oryzae]SDR70175.1 hypothetical protein SAMN05216221_0029 [Pseudomonas oryzae]